MQIEIQIQYYAKDLPLLCFRHAVKRALEGKEILAELGNFHDDRYTGPFCCVDCEADPPTDADLEE